MYFLKLMSVHGLAFMTVHEKSIFGTDVYLIVGEKGAKVRKTALKKCCR